MEDCLQKIVFILSGVEKFASLRGIDSSQNKSILWNRNVYKF